MRHIALTSLILASPLATAGVAGIQIPDMPEITNPKSGDKNTSLMPTLQSQSNYEIASSQWRIYQPEANIQLVGGAEVTSNGFFGDGYERKIDFPFDTTIDGIAIDKLQISNDEIILRGANNEELGLAKIRPVSSNQFEHQPELKATIAIKQFEDAIAINWYLQDSVNTPASWKSTFQVTVTNQGLIGIRSSLNDLSNSLFDNMDGAVGCGLRHNGNIQEQLPPLGSLKTALTNASETEFSFGCELREAGMQTIFLSTATPESITLPNFSELSSENKDVTLTENQALAPATQYQAQVRYQITAPINEEAFSAWSEPVSFLTKAASNFIFSASSTNFTADTATDITITVNNSGTGAGTPKLTLRLPIDGSNFSSSDYALTHSSAQCSGFTSNLQTATVSCVLPKMEAGSNDTVSAKVLLAEGINEIEYQLCEEVYCDETFVRLPVTVTTAGSDNGSENNDEDSGNSSSGGGGAIALLLLATPFLRRRRVI